MEHQPEQGYTLLLILLIVLGRDIVLLAERENENGFHYNLLES
jgi:hypothetical protein